MALFITQCPYCQTTFRTSVSQLQSAEGMVRCGACLKVFVADDNLLPSADLQTLDKPVRDEEQEEAETAEEDFGEPQVGEPVFTLVTEPAPVEFPEPTLTEPGPHWEILEEAQPREEPPTPAVEHAPADIEPAVDPHLADEAPDNVIAAPEPPLQQPPPMHSFSALDDDFSFARETPSTAATPLLSRENLDHIASARDALELDWRDTAGRKARSAWWSVGVVALVLVLAAQVVFFQWSALEQSHAARPWLQRICSTLPCSLAPMADVRAIASDNLVVRSHTEIANALNVTLAFRNTSAFEQALPALNLHFLNADNDLIAARQFSPDEYLPEALATLKVLPPGAPVQISFDILDPGMSAIHYEVSFSPYPAP